MTWYGLVSTLAGTISHIVMVYIFCAKLHMGYKGVVIATGLMFLVRFLVNFALVKLRDDVRKYPNVMLFSRETISNLSPLLLKSCASVAFGIWSWWSYDILTLMAM